MGALANPETPITGCFDKSVIVGLGNAGMIGNVSIMGALASPETLPSKTTGCFDKSVNCGLGNGGMIVMGTVASPIRSVT